MSSGARAHVSSNTVQLTDGVRCTTLPSGARVVSEPVADVRSVTVGFWLRCGSRDERAPVAGASHFLEHLLFKGTRRRSAQDIAEELDAVGAEANAFTSKEFTCFYARCLDRDLPLALDVLGDMITDARLRSGDIDAEREVVLEEISLHHDTPDDLVHSVFAETLFGDHPLGREVLGSEATIEAMTRDQVNRYYLRHYVPENLVVAAAGNLDHDRLVELVVEALGDARADQSSRIARRTPRRSPRAQTVVQGRPTEQAHLLFGGPGMARSDERRYAASVLNQALGGGMSSRLFQEIRERRGLVYTVFSNHTMHTDAGTFAVYAGTTPRKVGAVLDVVREQYDAVCADSLTEVEVERAKGHLVGSMVLALEDTGSRMTRLGRAVSMDMPVLSLDEAVAAIESVTAEDIRGVAAELLSGPFTLALVGPEQSDLPLELDRYTRAA